MARLGSFVFNPHGHGVSNDDYLLGSTSVTQYIYNLTIYIHDPMYQEVGMAGVDLERVLT